MVKLDTHLGVLELETWCGWEKGQQRMMMRKSDGMARRVTRQPIRTDISEHSPINLMWAGQFLSEQGEYLQATLIIAARFCFWGGGKKGPWRASTPDFRDGETQAFHGMMAVKSESNATFCAPLDALPFGHELKGGGHGAKGMGSCIEYLLNIPIPEQSLVPHHPCDVTPHIETM